MKILVLTQYFPPEKSPIPEAIAEDLASHGHEVRVVTGYPNYPQGKLYPGYRIRGIKTEMYQSGQVMRVPLVVSHSSNAIGRILNYTTFGVSAAVGAWSFARQADVVYVYATQMTASIPALLWNKVRNQPYVLHVQDLWPGSVTGSGMLGPRTSRVAEWLMLPWLTSTYRHAAAVVGISPSMTRILKKSGAVNALTVLNWTRESHPVSPHPRQRATSPGSGLNLIYAGNLGEMQDLETVIRAVGLLGDVPGLNLRIFGTGLAEKRLQKLVEEENITNVTFCGRVPREELFKHLETADFQLVPLKRLAIFEGTVPSKLQGSLREGIPVITTVAGDVASIISDSGAGIFAEPGSVGDLSAAIKNAYFMSNSDYEKMSGAAKQYYAARMSRDSGLSKLREILELASTTIGKAEVNR